MFGTFSFRREVVPTIPRAPNHKTLSRPEPSIQMFVWSVALTLRAEQGYNSTTQFRYTNGRSGGSSLSPGGEAGNGLGLRKPSRRGRLDGTRLGDLMASDPTAREPRRNPRFGRYEVLHYLATGGMGAVYRARDVETGLEVALKVLPPEIAVRPGMLERFRQEALHASKLHHEHIVTLFEYGEANHTHYLAMEFVEGVDLHEYVSRKGPLGPDEARVIIGQAALALDYAHEQSIVHRDIKPSNFLITRKDGRLWVKLTDFGLAREANDEECRVTRAGSTVGTVDYMAPEQARDSRAADRRSDIYSLGCTLYFMLSGRPPFNEGGLSERLLQHVEKEPVDICLLNPHVPHALAAVLQRMLAKKPANRYQSAGALLDDLERMRTGGKPGHLEVFSFLDDVDGSSVIRRRRYVSGHVAEHGGPVRDARPDSSTRARRPGSSGTRRRVRDEEDTDEALAARTQALPKFAGANRRTLLLATPVILLLFLLGSGLTWWLLRGAFGGPPAGVSVEVAQPNSAPEPAPVVPAPPPSVTPEPVIKPDPPIPQATPPEPAVKPVPPRVETGPPRMPQAAGPVPAADLRTVLEKPWAAPVVRPAATTLRVSRTAHTGDGRQFKSLAEAVAAAPPRQETIIEIQDNGPLFEPAVAVADRSLILRAARGYRPLVVWERGRPGTPRVAAFLAITGGSLTLDGLDLVHDAGDAGQTDDTTLCRVTGGDFTARDCTFSAAGRPRAGVTLIQLNGRPPSTSEAKPDDTSRVRCRLSRCYLRGGDCVALDLHTPGADALLEDCLAVGDTRPLLQVAGHEVPTNLHVVRTTLVAAQTILHIRPASARDTRPQVHWIGWDALLARCGTDLGGAMIELANGASSEGMRWQATNCLYAGWPTLLLGRENLSAASLAAWQARWGRTEGDYAVSEVWPARTFATPWDEPPDAYRTEGTHVWYAGTAGAPTLGCNLAALPPPRDAWHTLTFGRVVAPSFPMPFELTPPEIPPAGDGLYHGERLNISGIDLGTHLEKMGQKMGFGPKVVLHLSGSGEHHTSPIRVKGSSLILYVEPAAPQAEPLVLNYVKGKGDVAALIDVDGGNLELLGVSLKLANNTFAPHPRHLVHVRGGDLRVFGCRLVGPLSRTPKTFAGLIGFEGSGDSSAALARDCGIAESVLAAGNTCVHSIGSGARVRLRDCVVVAGRDAVHLDPGPDMKPRLNSQCFLDSCTVAARRAAIRLGDRSELIPLEPAIVQARSCAFLDPFEGGVHEAALVAFDGAALARGLLIWQGDNNGYDKRLPLYVTPTVRTGDRPREGYSAWSRVWGTAGDRGARVLDLTDRTFDLDKLPLATLELPASARAKHPESLGADLVRLRILKKLEKSKPTPLSP